MTRKDYELIASAIRDEAEAEVRAGRSDNALYGLARTLSHRLRMTNPRFEVVRFMAACGFPADV